MCDVIRVRALVTPSALPHLGVYISALTLPWFAWLVGINDAQVCGEILGRWSRVSRARDKRRCNM